MTSTDERPVTSLDQIQKVDATDDEMFRGKQKVFLEGNAPAHWRPQAATQFRLLNFAFAKDGEIYVSASTGTVLDNANRWLKQFSLPAIDAAKLATFPKVKLLGSEGVWIEAEGNYAGGMGAAAKEGRALRGVIASVDQTIYTVKMIGTVDEVKAEVENLRSYCESLKMKQ